MNDGPDGSRGFTAVHDGYLGDYGLFHERRLWLSGDGLMLAGCDRFHGPGGAPPDADDEAVARFHIHPEVSVEAGANGEIHLVSPAEERWTFACTGAEAEIQDDIFFADPVGPRRSHQIIVPFRLGAIPEIRWTLRRA